MFGTREGIRVSEPGAHNFHSYVEAVQEIVRSSKSARFFVDGKIIEGNAHLVSVGADDDCQYSIPIIATRLLCTFHGRRPFVTITLTEARSEVIKLCTSLTDYEDWVLTREYRDFNIGAWRVGLHLD